MSKNTTGPSEKDLSKEIENAWYVVQKDKGEKKITYFQNGLFLMMNSRNAERVIGDIQNNTQTCDTRWKYNGRRIHKDQGICIKRVKERILEHVVASEKDRQITNKREIIALYQLDRR